MYEPDLRDRLLPCLSIGIGKPLHQLSAVGPQDKEAWMIVFRAFRRNRSITFKLAKGMYAHAHCLKSLSPPKIRQVNNECTACNLGTKTFE